MTRAGRRLLPVSAGWVAGLVLGCASLVLFAQPRRQDAVYTAVVDADTDPMREVTPEREAAADTFARLHHPELADLLSRLRASRHGAYDNAVRQLFRDSERLAKLKGRDPQRYELELETWKIGSRIQLATARLAMEDTPELRAELTTLLRSKLEIRTQLVQLDRDKTAARLERLDTDLSELRRDPEGQVAQDLERLLKAGRTRAAQAARRARESSEDGSDAKTDRSDDAVESALERAKSGPGASGRSEAKSGTDG